MGKKRLRLEVNYIHHTNIEVKYVFLWKIVIVEYFPCWKFYKFSSFKNDFVAGLQPVLGVQSQILYISFSGK